MMALAERLVLGLLSVIGRFQSVLVNWIISRFEIRLLLVKIESVC